MLLGGIRYLLPVIKAAHDQGYYVITADYLPNNIAHKYSDEYVNVSIIDKDAVLKVAIEKQIDGIMSFGVDPGVITASYVQNQMGLPSFGPFESVVILQNKDKFREFLAEHNFNTPKARWFTSVEDALEDLSWYDYPVIVKPTDSAGSKGVSRVDCEEQLHAALENAFQFSFSGHIIVEEFIEKKGCSSDSDCLSIDGRLSFANYSSQRFDLNAANPLTPSAYTWPSTFTPQEIDYLTNELQRLISLLGMKTAIYNVETRIGQNGMPYIMEVSPRGGGNRLSEMIRYAAGIDMITTITRYAVGDTIDSIEQRPFNGCWSEVVLHASMDGIFQSLDIKKTLPAEVVEKDIWVLPGDSIHAFRGANDAIGTLILRFKDSTTMEQVMASLSEYIHISISQ